MALSRAQRQRAIRSRRSSAAGESTSYSPRIDAFGTVHIGELTKYKARLIEFEEGKLAILQSINPAAPVILDLTSPIQIKGRLMRTTFNPDGEEIELVFQKAGCGCETPRNLKGGRNKLLRAAGVIE